MLEHGKRHHKMMGPKYLAWAVSISLAAIGFLIWKGAVQTKPESRVYRIGWDPDPPFQAPGADGRATGLAIELVREAARRQGIKLEWVRQQGGADAALRDQKVDLWPLLTVIPERKSHVHITEPYLAVSTHRHRAFAVWLRLAPPKWLLPPLRLTLTSLGIGAQKSRLIRPMFTLQCTP